MDTIKVNNNKQGLLYTAKEVAEGITIKEEDENDVTTDSRVELDKRFNPNINSLSKSDFDNVINRDEDINNKNM